MIFSSPDSSFALNGTVGDVTSTSTLYSCSSRCTNTSMCSSPRKPHRRPWPSALLYSRCVDTLGSVSSSFATPVCSASNDPTCPSVEYLHDVRGHTRTR